jgi:phage host-nuclease inhibitor protein Gam
MAARLKAPAQAVPQTLDEAEKLATELGEEMRVLERHTSRVSSEVALITAKGKEISAPIGKSIDAKFKALSAFCQAHKAEILPKDRKSLNIAAGMIGWRLGNRKIEIDKGQEDAVTEFLEATAPHFLREVITIDKEALLANPLFVERLDHVSIVQGESFFFKPLSVDLEKVKAIGDVPAERDAA